MRKFDESQDNGVSFNDAIYCIPFDIRIRTTIAVVIIEAGNDTGARRFSERFTKISKDSRDETDMSISIHTDV